jgi:tricorn protease
MQGELGTSHAYEYGGDYRQEPDYKLGFLGVDLAYDPVAEGYSLERLVRGDSWLEGQDSPLHRLGINAQPGDLILAVAGQEVDRGTTPQSLLVHRANQEVNLTLSGPNRQDPRTVTVRTLANETPLRYRAWVEANHRYVTELSQGRIGYLHVPDMMPAGYAEFHRHFFAEAHKEALLVDVRYNGGGHVSQLLLEKLARIRLGYCIQRWGSPEPYPADSRLGPVVALTNEYAGSDGDIFSHCFKLMGLGPLVGKRTWGGVIGIWPRHPLADGSTVTQPEFAHWFTDVGWKVENYGTDPDLEVEISPQQWAKHQDPQLDKAIDLLLATLAKNPVGLPNFDERPRLTLP